MLKSHSLHTVLETTISSQRFVKKDACGPRSVKRRHYIFLTIQINIQTGQPVTVLESKVRANIQLVSVQPSYQCHYIRLQSQYGQLVTKCTVVLDIQ